MARVPPSQPRRAQRGPLVTEKLPEKPDARKTWSGPPYQRSPGRWSGSIDFGGAKHTVPTSDSPREWGRERDRVLQELRADKTAAKTPRTPLEGRTVRQFVGADGSGWPWDFERNKRRKQLSTFEHHEQHVNGN